VAVALLPIARGQVATAPTSPPEPARSHGERTSPVLLLYFGVGFVALGLEVVWFRFLSLIIRNTVYTYTLVLTVMLLGIVLGSWLAARVVGHRARCALVFGWLQILSGLCVLTLMMLPPAVWRSLESALWICALLLLVPSVLGGASFPLAVRLVAATRPPRRSAPASQPPSTRSGRPRFAVARIIGSALLGPGACYPADYCAGPARWLGGVGLARTASAHADVGRRDCVRRMAGIAAS
jgi:hypothetical protein